MFAFGIAGGCPVRKIVSEQDYLERDARSHPNALYGYLVAKTFREMGGRHVVICPGSRNTPLVCGFANVDGLSCLPVLDERSASFFALGIAKRTRTPVAIICTSGSAVANFLPAVVEAHYSRVPLLVLSADRPPELRECYSGQTIRQENIFGSYAKQFCEMPIPVGEEAVFRQAVNHVKDAYALAAKGAVVHLNFPFRDPLVPTADIDPDLQALSVAEILAASATEPPLIFGVTASECARLFAEWEKCEKGMIIAGSGISVEDAPAVCALAQSLGWVVLADAISSLRGQESDDCAIIGSYDVLLRQKNLARELVPDGVIILGPLPTSKVLRQWLADFSGKTWTIDERDSDVSAGLIRGERIYATVQEILPTEICPIALNDYGMRWQTLSQSATHKISELIAQTDDLLEPCLPILMERAIPAQSQVVVANSMPVRDMEFFWQSSDKRHHIFCNRGANGIDGTLSTAFGIAHDSGQPTFLLTGDLALLHDANGFLMRPHFRGRLTIILINNQGGGIFSLLPIAARPEFSTFFQTPQEVDFASLCAGWKVTHQPVKTQAAFLEAIKDTRFTGIRVLEVPCDTQTNKALREKMFSAIAGLTKE